MIACYCRSSLSSSPHHSSLTVNATDLLLVTAYLASQPNILHVDRRLNYASPPLVSSSSEQSIEHPFRFLREYDSLEVMSTRQDVQTLYAHNIHGENQLIGLSDTGIDIHSCFFHDPDHLVRYSASQPDTGHRKIYFYIPYCNDREDASNAHGTHVAGTLVGESNYNIQEASAYDVG